jgi:UDP-N-acetylmuramoylalanine-D-glutamate ligase
MHRIWGIDYDFSVLTNITQDHLDLHRTMKDYVNTKLQIFKNLIIYNRKDGIKKTAVINIDSDYHELFTAETYDSLYTYGMAYEANLHPENIQNKKHHTEFTLEIP